MEFILAYSEFERENYLWVNGEVKEKIK